MLGHVVAGQQRHAAGDGAAGQVLDQLAAHRRRRHDVDGGDDPLDLAADVGGVPARPTRPQPGEHQVDHRVPVDPADRDGTVLHSDSRGSEPELVQLLDPPLPELGSARGHDLVGSGLRPRPTVPGPPQRRAGLLAGVLAAPLGLVAVDVAGDLRGAGAERPGVRRELGDLAGLGVERVAVRGEHRRGTRGRT